MRAVLIGLLYAALTLPLHRRVEGQGPMLLAAAVQIGPAVLIGMVLRLLRCRAGVHAAACIGITLAWTALSGVLPDPRAPGFARGLAAVVMALPFPLFLFALSLVSGAALVALLRGR